MTDKLPSRPGGDTPTPQPQGRLRWGWWFFAAVALFYLLTEHRAHLFGLLPYLLLLACPLMHRFMHRGRHAPPDKRNDPREDGT